MLVAQEGPKLLESHRRKAQVLERRDAFAVVEDAQHNFLAEDRAERRHAQVDLLAIASAGADTAVLR